MNDYYVHGDLILKNGRMLALFVRTIDKAKQARVGIYVDEHCQVF